MDGTDHGDEFVDTVFPAEVRQINERRKVLGIAPAPTDGGPATGKGLTGISLSGGGIRSATFSLGVIQALATNKYFKNIDYLSTVSGGGYIGSCLSALLSDKQNKTEGEHFPLKYVSGAAEPPALTHLRNSSNYLSPGDLFDKLRLPNLLIRGIFLNLLVFLPLTMLAAFLTEWAYEKGPHWDNLPRLIGPLFIAFLVLTLLFPLAVRILRRVFNWRVRNAFERGLTWPLLLIAMVLLVVPVLNVTRMAIEHSTWQLVDWLRSFSALDVWRLGAAFIGVMLLFMVVGKASENSGKWGNRLLCLILGLLGPSLVFLIFLGLCLWQFDSPFIPVHFTEVLEEAAECGPACPISASAEGAAADFATVQLVNALAGRGLKLDRPATVSCSVKNNEEVNGLDEHVGASATSSVSCPPEEEIDRWRIDRRVWTLNSREQGNCPDYGEWESTLAWEDEKEFKDCLYFARASERSLRIEGAQLDLFSNTEDWWYVGIFIFLLVFNRIALDANLTTPHGFYRDRLSRAFLFRTAKDDNGMETVVPNDDLRLSDLNGEGTVGPYHLLNVTLNLQGSDDPSLRGRAADFFFFSHLFSGSDRTGYASTSELEQCDPHLNLGTAMAISGAAAAPNMGTTTNRALVFILTLLNIRLGYWLANPSRLKRKDGKSRRIRSASPMLVVRESLGLINDKGKHVNVSDGAHIENLGLYPLLKRRCKYIIAVDSEADPTMTFEGLVNVIRFARIDMGIEIKIDLDEVRRNYAGISKQNWTLGDIHYGDDEVGHLLYIKLSLTGDEPEYLKAYRAEHKEYPHQSTADQFFDEAQFEAYRALGEHIGEKMLRGVDKLGGFAHLGDSVKTGAAAIRSVRTGVSDDDDT